MAARLRQLATVDRRTGNTTPGGWPGPIGDDPVSTVVDLGLPAPANLSRLVADRPSIVLVCRVTVPGVRLAEHLLTELAGQPVVLAAVGASRWPGRSIVVEQARCRLPPGRDLEVDQCGEHRDGYRDAGDDCRNDRVVRDESSQ